MKIIAVDDDLVSLNLLSDCLQTERHHDVTLKSSALDALETLRKEEIPFDCILLDIEMPELSGIDLCREIRCLEAYPSAPILMITRYRDQSSISRAFANGATDYIKKPFDAFEVLTRIKVAERLVQERQAAIDSYIAVRSVLGYKSPVLSAQHMKNSDAFFTSEAMQIRLEGLLPLSVFQNYLEQVSETEVCDAHLFAVRIRDINKIFASMDASGFLKFLEAFTGALKSEFGAEDTFLSHAGNGTILCAIRSESRVAPEEAQLSIYETLKDYYPRRWDFDLAPGDIVSGRPISLNKTQKLNFKRAVKAALARLDQRAEELESLIPSKRVS
jgi:DNA-binding response OmpR family regulator